MTMGKRLDSLRRPSMTVFSGWLSIDQLKRCQCE